jgi:hypothetical protein
VFLHYFAIILSLSDQSWELYREAQRRYRKEVRKASIEVWMTFCNSINNLPMSARLHKAVSRDPKIELGFLVAPSGMCTQSKGEALEPLLATHFPSLVVSEGMAAPAAAHHARQCGWWVAAKFVTYG